MTAIPMKAVLRFFVFACFGTGLPGIIVAQQGKETSTDISKASQKGLFYDVRLNDNKEISISYGTRKDKKNPELVFEDYVFDKDLQFKGMTSSKTLVELIKADAKPDYVETKLYAYAGGSNSFNVLSQKLTLQKEAWQRTWNYDKQRYDYAKRVSNETVKPKNGEGKYLAYSVHAADNGACIIGSYEPDKKGLDDQFVILNVDMDLNIKETLITTEGNYSLVYSASLENGNVFVVMAPNSKMPDTKQYMYAEFTSKAELVKRNMFTAPSSNMLVMDHKEAGGSLFLCCASTNEKGAYNDEFMNYASIPNPGAPASNQGMKYNKMLYKKEMDNFHFLKFADGKVLFASTVPVKSFKNKLVTPPSQKKSHSYEGKKLNIEKLDVLPGGNILLAGQLMDIELSKGDMATKYLDIVAFMFDAKGELRAQYAVEKINDDTKSEIWQSRQSFHISEDGKTAYWEIYEVQGSKGYDSFYDAYVGTKTYRPHFFPRIAKINLATAALSDFEVLGSKQKFLMYNAISGVRTGNAMYYIGHDEDYEKLWIGKYTFL